MNNNSRAQELLNKVYEHLDSIDVSKLSFSELRDFMGVVQQCQFQENYGKMQSPLLSGFNVPGIVNGSEK